MRRLSEDELNEINEYLSENTDVLYEKLILAHIAKDKKRMLKTGEETQEGRKLFKSIEPSLKKLICHEWEYCSKRNNPEFNDNINLVAAIGDVVATLSIGIPPFLIASILIRKGLNKFCECS